MAVPQLRDRKTRERGGTTSSSALTPPSQNSFSTEQDAYSSSPPSPMSFQQSDDAGGVSRSLSPLQLPRSQDDASTESNEQSFQSRFQFSSRHEQTSPVTAVVPATSTSKYNSTSQQYPAMQNDTQGRYYPMPIRNGSQNQPFPVLSPVLSITEDLPSSPLPQDRERQEVKHEFTPEPSFSPTHQNTITSQSFAHADLHRSKLTVSPVHAPSVLDEERASGGMLVDNDRSLPLDSSSLLRIRSNAFVGTSVIPTAKNEFIVGAGVVGTSETVVVEQSTKTSEPNDLKNHGVYKSSSEEHSSGYNFKLGEVRNGHQTQRTQDSVDWHTDLEHTDLRVNTQLSQRIAKSSKDDSHHQNPYSFPKHLTSHHPDNSPNNQGSLNNTTATTAHSESTTSRASGNVPPQVIASPSRMVETASFHHTLLETGYIKTDVATPHMVVRGEDIDAGHRQTSPFASEQLLNKDVSTSVSQFSVKSGKYKNASGSQVDNQAELLEDFIDGL